MADDPNWADVLSAVGTCLIGLAALSISILTYRVESAKLRRERLPEQKKILRELEEISMLLVGHHENDEKKRSFDLGVVADQLFDMSLESISLFGYKTSSKISELHHEINKLFFKWSANHSKSFMNIAPPDTDPSYKNMWDFFISDNEKQADIIGKLFIISDSMRSIIDPNPKIFRLWTRKKEMALRAISQFKTLREYLRNSA